MAGNILMRIFPAAFSVPLQIPIVQMFFTKNQAEI